MNSTICIINRIFRNHMDKNAPQKVASSKLNKILRKYFVAVWMVAITFVISILISPLVPPDISSLFFIAVMVSAWRGGLGAGLLATVLSVLIDVFVFLPPTASFSLDSGDFVQLIVDVFAAVVVGTLSASKAKAKEERQELLLREQSARIEAEEANKVKDEFLAAVSHELRTPLTTIKTLTRILLRRNPLESEQRGHLEDISSECDRQIDLVHNLLDLSRIKAGGVQINLERVSVEEVLLACEKIERVEAMERNHHISVNVAPDLPFVYADRDALRRVICTITENAVKYTPDYGSIELNARRNGNDNYIVVDISDNGRGINEIDVPHIFESFYRGRTGQDMKNGGREISGVGLGLYLARSLVEAMHGEVEVESRIGRGSTFTIRLPIWRESPSDKPSSERKNSLKIYE